MLKNLAIENRKTIHTLFNKRLVFSPQTRYIGEKINSVGKTDEPVQKNGSEFQIPINDKYMYDHLIKNNTFSKAQTDKLLTTFEKYMNLAMAERIKNENMTTREDLLNVIQVKTNAFNKIENEIILKDLEKLKDYKQELARMNSDLEKLEKNFNMEIRKCNGSFKLDLSLEKGRIKEINANQELKIKDIDTKLSEEINNINTKIESNKTQLVQWMYTMVFAALGIVLAFFRLLN